jgi:hypothetical protein
MTISGLPTALRASASLKRTPFGRRKRVFIYDAYYADGQVETDVNADKVLDGQRFPADAWTTRQSAEAACPEVGAGLWVEYASGRTLDYQPGN